jgi:hypothetical protein
MITLLLASYGVMFTVTRSHLPVYSEWRDGVLVRSAFLSKLFDCAFCSGFWSSLAVNAAVMRPTSFSDAVDTLGFGFAGATFCLLLQSLLNRLDVNDDRLSQ